MSRLTYAQGRAYGKEAFGLGIRRAPALDMNVTSAVFFASLVGQADAAVPDFMKGWLAGWDEANLASEDGQP